MIQVYTGNGKGKTTAAIGLGMRAIGAGQKVLLIQFLKDGQSSELKSIKFDFKTFGQKGFINKDNLNKRDFNLAEQGFSFFKKELKKKKYDLIILDEINHIFNFKLIEIDDLINLIKDEKKTEIILTGRNAPKKIIQIADLVTEMKEVKHYFKKIKARRGIEY